MDIRLAEINLGNLNLAHLLNNHEAIAVNRALWPGFLPGIPNAFLLYAHLIIAVPTPANFSHHRAAC